MEKKIILRETVVDPVNDFIRPKLRDTKGTFQDGELVRARLRDIHLHTLPNTRTFPTKPLYQGIFSTWDRWDSSKRLLPTQGWETEVL